MAVLGIVYDRIRWEEKALITASKKKRLQLKTIDSKDICINLADKQNTLEIFGDTVIQRCVSHIRGLHLTSILENFGLSVINPFQASSTCGNKLLTTLALVKAGIPVPETVIAFDPEAALKGFEAMGYPAVLKPVMGSWGRLVSLVKDRESAQAIIETREEIKNAMLQTYYIQKFVKRPPRDIRVLVIGGSVAGASYRYSPPDDWRTNVARGGASEPCPVTAELEQLALKSAEAVSGMVLAIDCMEGPEGLVVNEINGTPEFKGLSSATNFDVAAAILDYAIELTKK